MHYGQMKGFISLHRRFSSYNRKNLTIYSLNGGFHMEKIIICCLGEYLEAELKMILMIKKIVRANIVISVVEGSYYYVNGKGALNFIVET